MALIMSNNVETGVCKKGVGEIGNIPSILLKHFGSKRTLYMLSIYGDPLYNDIICSKNYH